MSLRSYLFLMLLASLLSWGAWLLVLFFIDPLEAGLIGLTIFYLSLFFAAAGTLSIIGFYVRRFLLQRQIVFRSVVNAFRQGILFAILIVGALYLQSLELLTWWNLVLFVLALTVLEVFFISHQTRREV
jgi:hypothetical protein